jgi:hypothetical protein
MASPTDYKYAGTAESVTGANADWSNPNYAKADDTSYTSSAVAKLATSDLLRLTNFGFSSSDIPSGSTIDGIQFVVSRYAVLVGSGSITDLDLYLYDDGRVGSNMASATYWPTSIGEATYGGATNMCGTSLTQADIVASTFGVELSAISFSETNTAYVDYIKIRVYYTASGGGILIPKPGLFTFHG